MDLKGRTPGKGKGNVKVGKEGESETGERKGRKGKGRGGELCPTRNRSLAAPRCPPRQLHFGDSIDIKHVFWDYMKDYTLSNVLD